ncbi:class I SAM-dependent methyltransferase [Lysobacter sp. cf310]|uniref:class I SAM-dependent methyltransferase n=1 Tax=Lysobacter sp. cf310 TaxID=1761790 RepID=UPI0008E51A3D|nr:class I SAM-dependent methyltransferase [Lysobacter sp. cf310]SFL21207.1 methyltransferase, TIGR00027 family [Lysobacter sp. cf310]
MSSVSTSMLVAAATVQRTRAHVEAEDAAIARACLAQCGGAGSALLWLVDHAFGRLVLAWLERVLLPGLRAHYAWRKRRIAQWARQACADGAAQVVLLGAGYDGLGCMLARRHPGLRVFELDREASIAIKRRALQALCLHPTGLYLRATDLARADPLAALRSGGDFDPKLPTLCIAEGVLMYLSQAQASALLSALARDLARPTVVATAMDLRAGRPGFHREHAWVRRWLARRGEPFLWGCGRPELTAALSACGLQLQALADPADPVDPDPSPGEWLFLARRPDA